VDDGLLRQIAMTFLPTVDRYGLPMPDPTGNVTGRHEVSRSVVISTESDWEIRPIDALGAHVHTLSGTLPDRGSRER
jgi:hypothetical protein